MLGCFSETNMRCSPRLAEVGESWGNIGLCVRQIWTAKASEIWIITVNNSNHYTKFKWSLPLLFSVNCKRTRNEKKPSFDSMCTAYGKSNTILRPQWLSTDSQVCIRISRGLVKTKVIRFLPQSFWFSRSVGRAFVFAKGEAAAAGPWMTFWKALCWGKDAHKKLLNRELNPRELNRPLNRINGPPSVPILHGRG